MFSRVRNIVLKTFILVNIFSLFLEVKSCPPAEDIAPCKCFQSSILSLECKSIHEEAVLKKVFQNSKNRTYTKVHILNSKLEYLPYDLFTHTQVLELHLQNVILESLFDSPPDGLSMLRKLHLEETNIFNGMSWYLLEPLPDLRIITIYFGSFGNLNSKFSKYITKNLRQMTFYATGTRKIAPGALKEFTALTKVAMDSCKLRALSRDMFPTPFNVNVLYFNDNQITTITNDLFTKMPKLQTLGLRNNHLSVIPETAFESNIARISHVWLDGNPLKCDCLLQWVIKKKPNDLRGSCDSPKQIYGRGLKDLDTNDLSCL